MHVSAVRSFLLSGSPRRTTHRWPLPRPDEEHGTVLLFLASANMPAGCVCAHVRSVHVTLRLQSRGGMAGQARTLKLLRKARQASQMPARFPSSSTGRAPLVPLPPQLSVRLLLVYLVFIGAICTAIQGLDLIIVLIDISLVTENIEHLFT